MKYAISKMDKKAFKELFYKRLHRWGALGVLAHHKGAAVI